MDSVNSYIYKLTREKGVAHYEQCMGDKRKGVKYYLLDKRDRKKYNI